MLTNRNSVFKKSKFLQHISVKGKSTVIWHSLFGYPQIVTTSTLKFLDEFSTPKKINSVIINYDPSNYSYIDDLVKGYFLIPENFDERTYLAQKMKEQEAEILSGARISYLELIMSEVCNFRCTYCIHFKNLAKSERQKKTAKFMNYYTALNAVGKFLNVLHKNGKEKAEINFGGGEPLLVWTTIEKIINYCEELYREEFDLKFSLNTNASLMSPDIAKKLKKYKVQISTSLDGNRFGNDAVRCMDDGKSAYGSILTGFQILYNVKYPLTGFAATIDENNFDNIDKYLVDEARNFLLKRSKIRIDMDVLGMANIKVDAMVDKLREIRKYAKQCKIDIAGFWARPAENLNDSTLDKHIAFCGGARGNSLCIVPSGGIYSCGYSHNKLGSIEQFDSFFLPENKYFNFVKTNFTGAKEMCKGCMIEGQCNGGCNITHEFANSTSKKNIEKMCDFYRKMTKELLVEQLTDQA